MRTLQADLLLDARADLGEGPVWHAGERKIYWIDITHGELHAFDPATGLDVVHPVGQQIGCAVPRASGGFILGLQHGFAAFDPARDALTMIADPESQITGNRFNDGKCDPAGRLLAGTIGKPGTATLWQLDTDLHVKPLLRNITCSNGQAWSADHGTFFYIDTPTRTIEAFDYDVDSGTMAQRRTVVVVPEAYGVPDGMAIDAEDKLWVGHWGGGHVVRWDPRTGQPLARITVPSSHTTSCAFGGATLEQLYITTARRGTSAETLQREPHAGGLFIAQPGVPGAPVANFAG